MYNHKIDVMITFQVPQRMNNFYTNNKIKENWNYNIRAIVSTIVINLRIILNLHTGSNRFFSLYRGLLFDFICFSYQSSILRVLFKLSRRKTGEGDRPRVQTGYRFHYVRLGKYARRSRNSCVDRSLSFSISQILSVLRKSLYM